jgi:enoyl-CoA hydratase/carnithine racemase
VDDLTQLKVVIADHIATLTLNAPPVNALTRVLNDELTLALDRISELDDVRAVIHRIRLRRAPGLHRSALRGRTGSAL